MALELSLLKLRYLTSKLKPNIQEHRFHILKADSARIYRREPGIFHTKSYAQYPGTWISHFLARIMIYGARTYLIEAWIFDIQK